MVPVTQCNLTVLFEDPFWIGIFERTDESGYAVARTVFGAEPTTPEIYDFVRERFTSLEFSPPLADQTVIARPKNFKRALREAKQISSEHGIGTKAQVALQLQLEENKQERKTVSKEEREQEAERKFLLRQQRKKEKHRGH